MTLFEFLMPDPGEGLTEAELVDWYVSEGEEVTEDEPLCDVETDKAVVEIPVPCSGTVEELLGEPGDVIQVGDVLAVFETDNPPSQQQQASLTAERVAAGEATVEGSPGTAESEAQPDADAAGTEVASEPSAGPTESAGEAAPGAAEDGEAGPDGDRIFAAPRTRRYAREQGVDLGDVEGTGPNGRILREDVDRHVDRRTGVAAAETRAGGASDLPAVSETQPEAEARDTDRVVRRPLSGIRRQIAENMVRSKQEIPHVTSGFEADAEELVALKERLDEKHDARITYTPILVKAVVPALQEYPLVNASLSDDGEEILEKRYYNVGVATHTENGLLVPVVKDVDRKSIVEIAEDLERLVTDARDRSIDLADLQDGTFTITNTGSHGGHGTFGTPIINPPEAAIMGVGQIENKPVAVDDETVEVRKRIGLTLSYDHRLVDGVIAGQFMEHVIEGLEDPDLLLSRI